MEEAIDERRAKSKVIMWIQQTSQNDLLPLTGAHGGTTLTKMELHDALTISERGITHPTSRYVRLKMMTRQSESFTFRKRLNASHQDVDLRSASVPSSPRDGTKSQALLNLKTYQDHSGEKHKATTISVERAKELSSDSTGSPVVNFDESAGDSKSDVLVSMVFDGRQTMLMPSEKFVSDVCGMRIFEQLYKIFEADPAQEKSTQVTPGEGEGPAYMNRDGPALEKLWKY